MAIMGVKERGVPMVIGTVKWFDRAKGFGFIEPSDGSEYAFVDSYAIERSGLQTLIDGQKVQYDIFPGMDGKAAAEKLVILD
jgi:CspA family cold shock protein